MLGPLSEGGPTRSDRSASSAAARGHPVPGEVVVLFGDPFPSGSGTWPLTGPGIGNLYEGLGWPLIDRVAEDALVEPET
jgi:hypothetical protein